MTEHYRRCHLCRKKIKDTLGCTVESTDGKKWHPICAKCFLKETIVAAELYQKALEDLRVYGTVQIPTNKLYRKPAEDD